ncbi:MAG TPA: aminopeptidase P family protein, partial [Gammaproteobacteria bacterium]|nr:aminopeptidase P family protein [Gammaproteobacteria bacterium]
MLVHEKADQAQALLEETGLDCWLIFARETGVRPDPGVELVVGSDVTWNSAFLFGRGGQRIAIVGRYDAPEIRAGGVFSEVIGYDQGISAPLLAALQRLDPQQIGLNYSTDDTTAD